MLIDTLSKFQSTFAPKTHIELRAQHNTTAAVSLFCGNQVGNSSNNISGVSARAFKNGVWGFSSAADLSDEAVKNVLRAATENAIFLDGKVGNAPVLLPAIEHGSYVSPTFQSPCEQKRYTEFCRELDNYIVTKYPNLASRFVSSRYECMEKLLVTSDGYSSHSYAPRSYIYVQLSAEGKDASPIELFEPYGGMGVFDENFSDPALLFEKIDALYEKVMQKREGVFPEAGTKTVILDGMLSGMLAHEAVGHTVEADLVLGGSVAAHSLNKRVASDLVTLVDFAHTAFGETAPLPVYVDDEGTPCEDAVIIDKGILTGYLNNRESAQHFGMKPQGNARAYLFSDEPLIRMRNTAILPGKDSLADMIASVEDGYYLIDTNNGQADTTGEFMFGVCLGYEIKNGKLGRAILDTTISGVAFEMLKTVDMVSNEMVWASSGYC
ncbi:MAG: TldD/PmbA family protein, partial [Clostridia bacterium]|nr:TldD/PmbA family protein [Clostridia bacterium]